MATTYTKSLASDFGNSLKSSQFHSEIVADVNITKQLLCVNTTGDQVDIIFASALSGAEQTTLNTLITNHVPSTVPINLSNITYSTKKNTITTTSYTIMDKMTFVGASYAKLYSVSNMDSGISSYDIKIYDKTNGNTIIETNLTNTAENIQTLGVGSNVNANKALWEIQAKKTGGSGNSKAYLDSIYIEYG